MKRIIPCVSTTLLLVAAGFFLPVLGVAGLLLCPLPLAVFGCLAGQRRMSMAELMIELTLFIIISPSMAVYFLVGCAPVSAIIYFVSREDVKEIKKFSGPESLLICAGTSIVFKIILIAGFYFFTGQNIFFPDSAQMAAVMQELYGDNPELLQAAAQIVAVFPYLMPTLLTVYVGFEVLFNYYLCGRYVKKISHKAKSFPPSLPEFKTWRFPKSLLVVGVASFAISFFLDSDTWFDGAVFLMNLEIIINVFMFIQGLALIFWVMEGFKLKRLTKFFIFLILMIPFFWAWLIVIGMSDMILNLRERIKFKENDNNEQS